MTPTQLLIPTYRQMLKALSAWLTKVGDHEAAGDVVLSARLAPDMFPLSTQVRFSCLQVFEGVAWLRGEGFPPIWHELLEEGRNGAESPGSLADAQARISEAIAFLKTLLADELDEGVELGKADYVQHAFAYLRESASE